jgi:hypothetical protein
MSTDVLSEKRPTYSTAAMAAIIVLAVLLLGTAIAFVVLLLSGRGGNYLLGTLLALEFLFAGAAVLLFARSFLAFREVTEDREEELLW